VIRMLGYCGSHCSHNLRALVHWIDLTHNRLFQPMTKQKRGVHNNCSSLSTKRITAEFREGENRPVMAYKSKKSVDHVQHALTDETRAACAAHSDWASCDVRLFLTAC